jgi:hypothetical protein
MQSSIITPGKHNPTNKGLRTFEGRLASSTWGKEFGKGASKP